MGEIGLIVADKERGERSIFTQRSLKLARTVTKPLRPKNVYSHYHPTGLTLEVVYQCPRQSCRRLFLAHYEHPIPENKENRPLDTATEYLFLLKSVVPHDIPRHEFPDAIGSISPSFVEIYNQAAHAETLGLTRIAGPGYRKALEFLIKDYVISENPDNRHTIERIELSDVIANHVSEPEIRSTASWAAWLGNDETHFLRRWKDHDINDLKQLIKLTVRWIETVERTATYEDEMPEKKADAITRHNRNPESPPTRGTTSNP